MPRGALLSAMGGLPRRAPPSPAIALLVSPPAQVNGGSSGKKGPPGIPGGSTHKCTRCKSRPKSGSGSGLCIRCKLQRDYGSPRSGFAAPRKKVPMMAVVTAGGCTPSAQVLRSEVQPPVAQSAPTAAPHTAAGDPVAAPSILSAPDITPVKFTGARQPLTIRLQIVGEPQRTLQWSTLTNQDDLTETTWPQLMKELESEADDFRPEPFDQIVRVDLSSRMNRPFSDNTPTSVVALPAEIVGDIGGTGGVANARLGMSRMPPILSLPEGSSPEYGRDEPPVSPPQVPVEGVSPSQAVVVTIPDDDLSSSDDVTIEECEMTSQSGNLTKIEQRREISETNELMTSISTSTTQITEEGGKLPTSSPYEIEVKQETDDEKQIELEVWRDRMRDVIRCYTKCLEEAFSALLTSPSETKWVTVLSVYQKKTVLSKILQRLAILQRELLPPKEHSSLRRVSRNAQKLFKAMIQLRGEMAATRNAQTKQSQSSINSVPQQTSNRDVQHNIHEYSISSKCSDSTNDVNSVSVSPAGSHIGVPGSFVFDFPQSDHSQKATQLSSAFCNPQEESNGMPNGGLISISSNSLPPKSLTEEADEEITKILAKLQKEDRYTAVPSTLSTENKHPIAPTTNTFSSLPVQQPDYSFVQNTNISQNANPSLKSDSATPTSVLSASTPSNQLMPRPFPSGECTTQSGFIAPQPLPEIPNGSIYASSQAFDRVAEHSSQWSESIKTEQNDMFLPKKPHVSPSVAAPQLRSLLARKIPPTPLSRLSTQKSSYTSTLYTDRGSAQPSATSADLFHFDRHHQLYTRPDQNVSVFNEPPNYLKVLSSPTTDYGLSNQQTSGYGVPVRGGGAIEQGVGYATEYSAANERVMSSTVPLSGRSDVSSGLEGTNVFVTGPPDRLPNESQVPGAYSGPWTNLHCPSPISQTMHTKHG